VIKNKYIIIKSYNMKKIASIILLMFVSVGGIAHSVSATDDSTKNATVSRETSALSGRACAQVITNAISPSGECRTFPTPCDVPEGWTTVNNCSSGAGATIDDVSSLLVQMHKDQKDFNDKKKEEETALAQLAKEKLVSRKKTIEAVRIAAQKTKDEKRKAVLTRLLDIQIKQFMNAKERVAKMPNISADLETQLNASIDTAVADLTAKKAEVAATTTPEQLKALAQEIKDLLKTKRDIVKQTVAAILASKADATISTAEGRLGEIKTKIAALKAAGQDTTALDNLLAAAQAKIVTAKTKAGKEDLKNAISDLKEAYKNMKSIVEKTNGAE